MERLKHDGVTWLTTPDFQSLLPAVLEAGASGQIVKESPSKLVTVCRYGDKTFYTKHYRHAAVAFRPLKFLFKPSQARQEWQLALQLSQRNIPIVRHVAFGERWHLGGLQESILITEGFSGVPIRQAGPAFAPQIAALIKRMHDQGTMQQDLHGQNILVDIATGEARLVDLHGIIVKDTLTEEEKMENLALLRKFLPVDVPPPVQKRGAEIRRHNKARRARRALRENRDFTTLSAGGLTWQIRQSLLTPQVEEILQDPDGFLEALPDLRKCGRSSTVGLADGLVLKRYNFKKTANLVKDRFRFSRALRAFRKSYHLELVHVPTAPAIAAANRLVLGFPKVSYLLMREIPGATELKNFRGLHPALVRPVAEMLARLHEEGFSHRDLKTANILLDQDQQPHLIDLEGLEFVGEISWKRAGADLARLARSFRAHPEYQWVYLLRFLKIYRSQRGGYPRRFGRKKRA